MTQFLDPLKDVDTSACVVLRTLISYRKSRAIAFLD